MFVLPAWSGVAQIGLDVAGQLTAVTVPVTYVCYWSGSYLLGGAASNTSVTACVVTSSVAVSAADEYGQTRSGYQVLVADGQLSLSSALLSTSYNRSWPLVARSTVTLFNAATSHHRRRAEH